MRWTEMSQVGKEEREEWTYGFYSVALLVVVFLNGLWMDFEQTLNRPATERTFSILWITTMLSFAFTMCKDRW
eukprot:scaffold13288_cov47-Cyclotella_meneghiniana.AAC.3